MPEITIDSAWIDWLQGSDTGISSETIWSAMTGLPVKRHGLPSDPSDFGRCHRLLERFPDWRARLHEVAARFPTWSPLVRAWPRLTELYLRDLPTGKSYELWCALNSLRIVGGDLDCRGTCPRMPFAFFLTAWPCPRCDSDEVAHG